MHSDPVEAFKWFSSVVYSGRSLGEDWKLFWAARDVKSAGTIWVADEAMVSGRESFARELNRGEGVVVCIGDGLIYGTSARKLGYWQEAFWGLPEDAVEMRAWTELDRWVIVMREAIVGLRCRQLAIDESRMPSVEMVRQLRELAVTHFVGVADWRPSAEAWLDALMRFQARKLNELRWSLIQFLGQATLERMRLGAASDELILQVEVLLKRVNYSELKPQFLAWLDWARPILLGSGGAHSPLVERALAVMRQRHHDALRLSDLARDLGVSSPHLARKLKRETAVSFTEHLQKIRLRHAVHHLRAGQRTVLDIALSSGFGSVEQFYRVFREQYGCAPNTFRMRAHHEERCDAGTSG